MAEHHVFTRSRCEMTSVAIRALDAWRAVICNMIWRKQRSNNPEFGTSRYIENPGRRDS